MAAKKTMSTGKKVAVGALFTAAVGAILCYFFCPYCRKRSAAIPAEDGVFEDRLSSYGSAPKTGVKDGVPDIGWSGPVLQSPEPVLQSPASLTTLGVKQQLVRQRGLQLAQYHAPVIIE